MTLAENLDYWRLEPNGNEPARYLERTDWSEFLLAMIREHTSVKPADSILEVGCNSGRNLDYLHRAGYRKLTAIEINPNAVELLRETFPCTAGKARILVGSAEQTLACLRKPRRLVFSLSVLEHIHPGIARDVFDQMARLADEWLLTIEEETPNTWKHFARNYRRVFSARGFRQVFSSGCPFDTLSVLRVLRRR